MLKEKLKGEEKRGEIPPTSEKKQHPDMESIFLVGGGNTGKVFQKEVSSGTVWDNYFPHPEECDVMYSAANLPPVNGMRVFTDMRNSDEFNRYIYNVYTQEQEKMALGALQAMQGKADESAKSAKPAESPEPGPASASQFLTKAAALLVERGKNYDNPKGERSMEQIVKIFSVLTGHKLTPYEGWLFMWVLKYVRLRTARSFHQDSAEDMLAYLSLAVEAKKEEGGRITE